jgi:hypothetical protein
MKLYTLSLDKSMLIGIISLVISFSPSWSCFKVPNVVVLKISCPKGLGSKIYAIGTLKIQVVSLQSGNKDKSLEQDVADLLCY